MTPHRLRHVAAGVLAAAALSLLAVHHTGRAARGQDSATHAQQQPGAARQPAASDATGAPPPELVLTTVAVTDKAGRLVAGLGPGSFAFQVGKSTLPLAYFSTKEVPQSVGIVFDVSASMSPLALSEARGALVRLMREAHEDNEYFVLGFDKDLHPLTGWTRDGRTLIEALSRLAHVKAKYRGTSFRDACAAGIEKVLQGSQPRRVLVVVSDGQDGDSKIKFGKVLEMIKRSDVLVYSVGIMDFADDGEHAKEGRSKLEELAATSGGKAYFPSTRAEVQDAFQRIGHELRSRYTIGFVPEQQAAPGKWQSFKVRLTPPPPQMSLHVRGREGYYVAGAAKPD
jgi:Ca-activated chloride channel family protein